MSEIKDDTRQRIAEFLPGAIAAALKSYRDFLHAGPADLEDGQEGDPAKHFKNHHDACKVAIAHIELLIKLGKAVEAHAEDLEYAKRQQLHEMVEKAQKEIEERSVTKNI